MTFSIVARDSKTGEFGVAVQSHAFSVGSIVSWARAGVGAVATQAKSEASYGSLGLELMSSGKGAPQALEALAKVDPEVNSRQVGMVDAEGRVAAYTGKSCFPFSGHYEGKQFSCQGNTMKSERVWKEMGEAYEQNHKLPLAERLVTALEAGQCVGGDRRGMQSSAILVVGPKIEAEPWLGATMDLRVEDHPSPIKELGRQVRLCRAYDQAKRVLFHTPKEKTKEAIESLRSACEIAPEKEELQFMYATSLIRGGETEKAKVLLRQLCKQNEVWSESLALHKEMGRIPADFSPA